jgi:hypothetical protein
MDLLYHPSGGFCDLERSVDVLLWMPSASGHWTMLGTINDIKGPGTAVCRRTMSYVLAEPIEWADD